MTAHTTYTLGTGATCDLKQRFSPPVLACPAHINVFLAPSTPDYTNQLISSLCVIALGVIEEGKH